MIDMATLKVGDRVVGVTRGQTEQVTGVGQVSFLYMRQGEERQGLPQDWNPFVPSLLDPNQVYRIQQDGDLTPVAAAGTNGRFVRILTFERITLQP